jgi:precorrin-6B methylase 2
MERGSRPRRATLAATSIDATSTYYNYRVPPIDEEAALVRVFLLCVALLASGGVPAQTGSGEAYQPASGQPGKDVVWVPTPYALIEKMLDMAQVTPQDYVMDLGSGDGRNVIMAAKRGAKALGVEYNPEMVELSRRNAAKEGVSDKARFVQGDMFEADISQATVLALFLLPDNLRRLTPKFQSQLKPGTRLVMNGFPIPEWAPDVTEQATGDCGNWCTSHLYYAPAKVGGSWRLGQATLRFEQNFQMLSEQDADQRRAPERRGDQLHRRRHDLRRARQRQRNERRDPRAAPSAMEGDAPRL